MLEICFLIAKQPWLAWLSIAMSTTIGILALLSKAATRKKVIKLLFIVVFPIALILTGNFFWMSNYTEIPMVRGLPHFAAVEKLNNAHLLSEAPREDTSVFVKYQYPSPGDIVKKNSYVDLYYKDMTTQQPVLYNNHLKVETNEFFSLETNLCQSEEKGSAGLRKTMICSENNEIEIIIYCDKKAGAKTDSLVLRITLPDGIEYVPSSTVLFNSTNPEGLVVSDNITTSSGINIGGYYPQSNAYVKLRCILTKNPDNDSNTFVIWSQAKAFDSDDNKPSAMDFVEIKYVP